MLRYDQLHVLPVYQSYWIISGVVGGLVYFGEFEELSPAAINMFLLGTMITLFGLYQLTRKENHSLQNAGNNVGFDVLPSRRVSEDSFLGFDSESEGFGLELGMTSHDLQSPIDEVTASALGARPNSPRRYTRGSHGRSSSVSSLDSEDARLRRSPQQQHQISRVSSIDLS